MTANYIRVSTVEQNTDRQEVKKQELWDKVQQDIKKDLE